MLIRDETLIAVGPRAELLAEVGRDVTHRHHAGATILPGLINTHVHLVFDASADPVGAFQETPSEALYRGMAERARQCLDAGVTTIRDLGDAAGMVFKLRAAIDSGARVGPRILAAGVPLTPPGGHCWFLGGEVDGNDAIRERIIALAAAGADVIKVMASGGQMTPGGAAMWDSQFTAAQLRFVVEQAAAVGLPVAAHAHGAQAIADSVAAGVSTIEHCTWMGENRELRFDDSVAARMAEQGTYAGDTTPPRWQRLAARFPLPPGRHFGDRLPWMDAHGVPIIIGTDAGMPNSVFNDFASALTLYQEVGFPTERTLEFATVTAARALGLDDRTGHLTPGLAADVLVVDGNPLDELTALHRPVLVVHRGRHHTPSATDHGAI